MGLSAFGFMVESLLLNSWGAFRCFPFKSETSKPLSSKPQPKREFIMKLWALLLSQAGYIERAELLGAFQEDVLEITLQRAQKVC